MRPAGVSAIPVRWLFFTRLTAGRFSLNHFELVSLLRETVPQAATLGRDYQAKPGGSASALFLCRVLPRPGAGMARTETFAAWEGWL